MRFSALAIAACLCSGSLLHADVALIGIGTIAGSTPDKSGLKGKQKDGTPHNRLGGLGSAIAYTGSRNRYVLASDRGPADGASDFICRFHTMDIVVSPGQTPALSVSLVTTVLLNDESKRAYVGSLNAIDPQKPSRSMRFDPEGIRVGPSGTLFISDEYGPFLYEFDAQGHRLRALSVPKHFHAARPSAKPDDELPPKNTIGRQPNRGMEGLAISPDGTKLFGIMQSPLIQDGALDKDKKRIGVNCRLLEIDRTTSKTREFVYPLESSDLGASEILAVGKNQFLVLERDGLGGKDAKFKKIFLIGLEGASDVSAVAELPTKQLPKQVRPVSKKLFLDMLQPKHGIVGLSCPEKFEGIAFGPDLADGRRLLIVSVDNDFVAQVPIRFYAFAIDRADLPGFEAQRFE